MIDYTHPKRITGAQALAYAQWLNLYNFIHGAGATPCGWVTQGTAPTGGVALIKGQTITLRVRAA